MSIPYEAIHAAALPFVPEGTIKPATTWVGILLHSIKSVKNVTKHDLLWLKCHPRITLKTIKHEYFTRHPLEAFELQFIDDFPAETMQVKHFTKVNPIKGSNVIVLRAFEEEAMPKEHRHIAGLKNKTALDGRGQTSDNAIEVGDESDEERDSSDSRSSKKRKLAQGSEANSSEEEPANEQPAEDSDDANDGLDQESYMAEYQPPFPEHWDWTPFLDRLHKLPAASQDKVDSSPWSHCESCGKQMLIKPWTCFGPGHTPLCTGCSELQMTQSGQQVLINIMHEMRREEFAEKHVQASIGIRQNMDFDAGINWPFELGNVHMKSPIATPQPTVHDAVDGAVQAYTVATRVNKPPTPPTSDSGMDEQKANVDAEVDEQLNRELNGELNANDANQMNGDSDDEVDGDEDDLVGGDNENIEIDGADDDHAMSDFRKELEGEHDSGSEASFQTAGEEGDEDDE